MAGQLLFGARISEMAPNRLILVIIMNSGGVMWETRTVSSDDEKARCRRCGHLAE